MLRVQIRASESLKTWKTWNIQRQKKPCSWWGRSMTRGCTKLKKKKQKDCRAPGNRGQGAKTFKTRAEMAWAPPRNISKWPDREEARRMEDERVEAGVWRRSGSAGNHYRVGCCGRHFRGLGRRKPPWAGWSRALEKRKRDTQRGWGN